MAVGNRSHLTATTEELVTLARKVKPELAEELESWRCPRPTPYGFCFPDEAPRPTPGEFCGGRVVALTQVCSATMIRADGDAARRALAYGIDVGPPLTQEVPVAYDLFFHCEHGHKVYVRTENVPNQER